MNLDKWRTKEEVTGQPTIYDTWTVPENPELKKQGRKPTKDLTWEMPQALQVIHPLFTKG